MSWEPEVSTELLSTSINSIYYRCSSEADLTHLITGGGGGEGWAGAPLTADKRSHSIGYLPTYEWTVTDIPFDDHHDFFPTTTNPDDSERQQEEGPSVETTTTGKKSLPNYYKIYDDDEEDEFEIGDEETSNKNTTSQIKPPPESFYTLVPAITPLHGYKTMEQHLTELNGCGAASSHASDPSATQTRKVAYKKQSKLKHHHQHPKPKVGRTFSSSLHSNKKQQQHGKLRLHRNLPPLERSSSWPSLVLTADGDKWMNEYVIVDGRKDQLLNEWVNERMNEWMNKIKDNQLRGGGEVIFRYLTFSVLFPAWWSWIQSSIISIFD